jgi:hypothetical protein
MLRLTWFLRMLRDVAWMGVANRNPALSGGVLLLILLGLLAVGAQVSAPFIYTLF